MSFWKSEWHTARKQHKCLYCGKVIQSGEKYSRETGVYEGDFNNYCLCERCRDILHYFLGDSGELGEFLENIQDTNIYVCKNCGGLYWSNWEMANDCLSADVECADCGDKSKIDLSAEAIEKYFHV